MPIRLTVVFLLLLQFSSRAQETFSARKGPKFLPGHLHVVMTVDDKVVRYELFNHWYSRSYAAMRQMTVALDSLDAFNRGQDSVKIELQKNKIKLVDKRYRLSKNIKHTPLCASASDMRKISYAQKQAAGHTLASGKTLMHFDLYNREDLKLSEAEFEQRVNENVRAKTQ
jgi:hypothetical protein